MFLTGVNVSGRYRKWPVFSRPLMAGFGCPPRSYASPLEFERLYAAVPVNGARPVEALQAPTSQVELGLPVTTHAVTGFAAGA